MHVPNRADLWGVERYYLGDPGSRRELWFDARARTQALAVALTLILAGAGYRLVGWVTSWAAPSSGSFLPVVVGAGGGTVLAVGVTAAYAKFDKPQTRLDYWVDQVVQLLRAPKPPPPPMELEVAPVVVDVPSSAVVYEVRTPPPLSERRNHDG